MWENISSVHLSFLQINYSYMRGIHNFDFSKLFTQHIEQNIIDSL